MNFEINTKIIMKTFDKNNNQTDEVVGSNAIQPWVLWNTFCNMISGELAGIGSQYIDSNGFYYPSDLDMNTCLSSGSYTVHFGYLYGFILGEYAGSTTPTNYLPYDTTTYPNGAVMAYKYPNVSWSSTNQYSLNYPSYASNTSIYTPYSGNNLSPNIMSWSANGNTNQIVNLVLTNYSRTLSNTINSIAFLPYVPFDGSSNLYVPTVSTNFYAGSTSTTFTGSAPTSTAVNLAMSTWYQTPSPVVTPPGGLLTIAYEFSVTL